MLNVSRLDIAKDLYLTEESYKSAVNEGEERGVNKFCSKHWTHGFRVSWTTPTSMRTSLETKTRAARPSATRARPRPRSRHPRMEESYKTVSGKLRERAATADHSMCVQCHVRHAHAEPLQHRLPRLGVQRQLYMTRGSRERGA